MLTDASGEVTIELVGDAAALAATLHVGDLVNVSGTQLQNGRLIVDDPAALVRVPGLTGSTSPQPAQQVVTGPQDPQQPTAQAAQMAPIVAFGVIFGLTALLVIGAFAVKLYGPDRARNWANRLKARFVRI